MLTKFGCRGGGGADGRKEGQKKFLRSLSYVVVAAESHSPNVEISVSKPRESLFSNWRI